MKLNRYKTLAEAKRRLRARGFTNRFELKAKNRMYCLDNGREYTPDEMRIIEHHRFESRGNSSKQSVIFAVICHDNTRATIVSADGPYADIALSLFMDKVKILERVTTRTLYTSIIQ